MSDALIVGCLTSVANISCIFRTRKGSVISKAIYRNEGLDKSFWLPMVMYGKAGLGWNSKPFIYIAATHLQKSTKKIFNVYEIWSSLNTLPSMVDSQVFQHYKHHSAPCGRTVRSSVSWALATITSTHHDVCLFYFKPIVLNGQEHNICYAVDLQFSRAIFGISIYNECTIFAWNIISKGCKWHYISLRS